MIGAMHPRFPERKDRKQSFSIKIREWSTDYVIVRIFLIKPFGLIVHGSYFIGCHRFYNRVYTN